MKRKIIAFGEYYHTFLHSLSDKEQLKVRYVLSLLETQDRLPVKFIRYIRDNLYELRITYDGKIFRLFFIFDDDKLIVLFNGFRKKSQKTPKGEIEKALKIKVIYYEQKRIRNT
ncbi:MAG TPA: addiction module toxin RelE [Porphyromonadaceae bacterium]|jgi:phage-related protein|uniref:type II toxin-antitoxin system RelE/ParE family toxin n=1 Tax=Limibacterium fermenti TaxID=3229863 RepID=UPI000E887FA8|nr:addiction module toxin RelE [Porphyromonadaceae bacterium]HBK31308.1 addiction module toxin RelE [Porphyromonadaceae bacterium]HBL33050.1 addiction module toxin RelE [Porphyromonadaceae bacterium]HBX20923.1 addiction module toxin RelE [Porphyromonadaceae bacterium]HBX45080.1 addiction module toxin RelE [Porphyromonadaceae bacterium]